MKAAERHKLKHDKYAETVVTGLQWSGRHMAAVVTAAVAVLIVAAGIVWFVYSRQQALFAADEQLTKIRDTESQALAEKDAAREDAVRKVRADYDALIHSHPDSAIGVLASYWAATFLSEAGKTTEAAGYFEHARDMADTQAGLRTLAERGLAESLEASGKFEPAIRQYQAIESEAMAPASDKDKKLQAAAEAEWDIGRCYARLGQVQQATDYYKKAQQNGGDSMWGNLARFGLESLVHPQKPAPATTPAPKPETAPKSAAPAAPAPKGGDEKAPPQKGTEVPKQSKEATPTTPEAEKPAGK